ncbi:hypothetical protein GCM10009416_28130 [Craurococcus roseus]|uniref:Uncharacterized protein n=1 Tax=Craurococcus roseus TaxID=77585 RepID=A0ABN1FCF7_9PROT
MEAYGACSGGSVRQGKRGADRNGPALGHESKRQAPGLGGDARARRADAPFVSGAEAEAVPTIRGRVAAGAVPGHPVSRMWKGCWLRAGQA